MESLQNKVRSLIQKNSLLPNEVNYTERLLHLFAVGQMNLSLAKLAEAHWDALSILHEAGRPAKEKALYAVWASEIPNKPLIISKSAAQWTLNGSKMFCSGAGIADYALITAEGWLIEVDLTSPSFCKQVQINKETWITSAFKETNTATLTFTNFPITEENIIEKQGWYLYRKGFWRGALGPAACWGGGAAGLVDYGLANAREDAHTLAHLAAMESNVWVIYSILERAGRKITQDLSSLQLQQLALRVRHAIEQLCTDTLKRFARAYGPFPLACDVLIYQRYQELDLFLRQNHGERDLELLGKILKNMAKE
ncbi:acyl-CoA dehydrogenase family protein [Legionella saoudiensis]|uniref:hypothetical protein n=1 Tax=Legionella saoudiensis TaxID=1750561 RepID=UPI000730E8A7|nr:hypothetical protein [Legionella saoudiensis]